MSFDVKTRLSKLRSSAKARGINVNLDINKYQYVIDAGCHFCGDDLSKENGYCLDRIDNSKGYSIENVVGCCKICNRAKSDMEALDFVAWIERAYKKIQEEKEIIKNLKKFGITEEMFIELCHAQMNNFTKDKEKLRIKEVYK